MCYIYLNHCNTPKTKTQLYNIYERNTICLVGAILNTLQNCHLHVNNYKL